MANIVSLIIKNKPYDGTRLTIVGSQSGNNYFHYSEARGTRYMINEISSTASPNIESTTFEAFLSFTSSSTATMSFNLVPMNYGETLMVTTKAVAIRSDGSKGFLMNSFGGYRHSGSALTLIGGSFTYDYKTDFTGATAYFTTNATASVNLVVIGTSEVIDWDVHIEYIKGYHTLTAGANPPYSPPYNPPPPMD